jgi:cobyrinic acid a,c-diamide synthase
VKAESRTCRALLVSATSSNQGKTTITAALARHFSKQGMRVRVFKTGPDFIDPMILQHACGHAVHQLDLWMGGTEHCRRLLYEAAGEADLILVEGVMGLFDGNPSSADLAQTLGIPVLAVIDVAHGLRSYRSGLPFAGVIANRVGSARHADMLLPQNSDIRLFATLPTNADYALPARHLGLLQAREVEDIDARLDAAANALQWRHDDFPLVEFSAPAAAAPTASLLQGVRVAVASDAAFSFLYQANLDCLRLLGAELLFFSPLHDASLPPDTHSVYLPGGYPELHLPTLQNNAAMRSSLHAHVQADKPIFAECGGMLYLLDSLTSLQGESFNMLGLLPGHARMEKKLVALALQGAALPRGEVRGHSFHYSSAEFNLTPVAQAKCPNGGPLSEGVYQHKRITAGYIHFYFPSNPAAIAPLFL